MSCASVRDTTRRVMAQAARVQVHEAAVPAAAARVAEGMAAQNFSLAAWSAHALHPKGTSDADADFVFVMDALNFSFWASSPANLFTVEFAGAKYTGYWSLVAALQRALQDGIAITSPSFYAGISREQLSQIFRPATDATVPMLDERLQNLHEVGTILMQEFGGSFANCIRQCAGDAEQLVRLVVEKFPCFRDVAQYRGEAVWLLKRAQILVADVWGCYQGTGLGTFHNIDVLTMFADYRVPQVLVYLGLMSYTPAALAQLQSGALMTAGDELEVEIRAASIQAVELLRAGLVANGSSSVNAVMLDFFLWDHAKAAHALMAHIPIHHVRSINY